MSALLDLRDLRVSYPRYDGLRRRPDLVAVAGVSLAIGEGEALGLVGESGCGKSSLGRAAVGLLRPAAGEVRFAGERLDRLPAGALRRRRRGFQMVFQDPSSSVDPRMTVGDIVAEPLRALAPELSAAAREARVAERLAEVGLDPAVAARYPHQFSGGQLQRIGIARALVVDPQLVVCDEPVSALDVSVQGQIVNLFQRIRRERGLSLLFISHNLAVVARLCERIAVMYLGRLVEVAPCEELLNRPRHPYTRMLLDAVPAVDPATRHRQAPPPAGEAGNLAGESGGCAFAPRCPHAIPRCRSERPLLETPTAAAAAACHRQPDWPLGLPPPP